MVIATFLIFTLYSAWILIFSPRRNDSYDEAVSSLLSIGATVLKATANKILEYYISDNASDKGLSKNDVNKIGEAAPVDKSSQENQLTPEDLLKQQQVLTILTIQHFI